MMSLFQFFIYFKGANSNSVQNDATAAKGKNTAQTGTQAIGILFFCNWF